MQNNCFFSFHKKKVQLFHGTVLRARVGTCLAIYYNGNKYGYITYGFQQVDCYLWCCIIIYFIVIREQLCLRNWTKCFRRSLKVTSSSQDCWTVLSLLPMIRQLAINHRVLSSFPKMAVFEKFSRPFLVTFAYYCYSTIKVCATMPEKYVPWCCSVTVLPCLCEFFHHQHPWIWTSMKWNEASCGMVHLLTLSLGCNTYMYWSVGGSDCVVCLLLWCSLVFVQQGKLHTNYCHGSYVDLVCVCVCVGMCVQVCGGPGVGVCLCVSVCMSNSVCVYVFTQRYCKPEREREREREFHLI